MYEVDLKRNVEFSRSVLSELDEWVREMCRGKEGVMGKEGPPTGGIGNQVDHKDQEATRGAEALIEQQGVKATEGPDVEEVVDALEALTVSPAPATHPDEDEEDLGFGPLLRRGLTGANGPDPEGEVPQEPMEDAAVQSSTSRGVEAGPSADVVPRRAHQQGEAGLIQVSLGLHDKALRDEELEVLRDWYLGEAGTTSGGAKQWVRILQLKLHRNIFGDRGAKCVAQMYDSHMMELHLSHNEIGMEGFRSLLDAFSADKPPLGNGIWCRLEKNRLVRSEVEAVLKEYQDRHGLILEVPKEKEGVGYTQSAKDKLEWDKASSRHVLLPFLLSQVVVVNPDGGQRAGNREGHREPLGGSRAHHEVASRAPLARSVGNRQAQQHGAHPEQGGTTNSAGPSHAAPTSSPTQGETVAKVIEFADGPLLLFLDVHALLRLMPSSEGTPDNQLTLDILALLTDNKRFGPALPDHQQTHLVLTQSVMSELEKLRVEGSTKVERFLDSNLLRYGDQGLGFVTVLQQEEPEQGEEGGSIIPLEDSHLDVKLLSTATYFMKAGGGGQPVDGRTEPYLVPVLLLSASPALVKAAKVCHLPALDITQEMALQEQLVSIIKSPTQGDLSSNVLRRVLGPKAVQSLGSPGEAPSHEDPEIKSIGPDAARVPQDSDCPGTGPQGGQARPDHRGVGLRPAGGRGTQESHARSTGAGPLRGRTSLGASVQGSEVARARNNQESNVHGWGAAEGRSTQDELDGAVSYLSALSDAYEDLVKLVHEVSQAVSEHGGDASQAVKMVRQIIDEHQHATPFQEGPSLEVVQSRLAEGSRASTRGELGSKLAAMKDFLSGPGVHQQPPGASSSHRTSGPHAHQNREGTGQGEGGSSTTGEGPTISSASVAPHMSLLEACDRNVRCVKSRLEDLKHVVKGQPRPGRVMSWRPPHMKKQGGGH